MMSSSTVAGFPVEVWHMVCGSLDYTALAKVRLTCRPLSAIGAEYLVTHISFHTTAASLERLQLLAQHPHIRKGVTSLTYQGTLLQDSLTLKVFKEDYQKRLEQSSKNPQWATVPSQRLNVAALRQAYDKYRALRRSQKRLINSVAVRDRLFECIALFPKLTTLKIVNDDVAQHGLSARFKEEFDVGSFVPPLQYAKDNAIWQLQNCLVAGLTDIHLNSVTLRSFDGLSCRNDAWLCDKFSALRKLHLILSPAEPIDIEDSDDLDTEFSAIRKGHLKRALAAATQLQTLSLHFYDPVNLTNQLNFADVFGDNVWPHLTQLDLLCLDCDTEDQIMGMLSAQPRLVKLWLAWIPLIEGEWASVARKMRDQLNLNSFYVEGHLEDEAGVHDLELLHRTAWKKFYRVDVDDMLEMYVTRAAMPSWFEHEDKTEIEDEVQPKISNSADGYNPLCHYEDFGTAEELHRELGGPLSCVVDDKHQVIEWDGMWDEEVFDSEEEFGSEEECTCDGCGGCLRQEQADLANGRS